MDTVRRGSVEMQVPSQVAEVRENAVQNLRSVSMVLFYAEGPFIANTHVLCWHELQGKQGFFYKLV